MSVYVSDESKRYHWHAFCDDIQGDIIITTGNIPKNLVECDQCALRINHDVTEIDNHATEDASDKEKLRHKVRTGYVERNDGDLVSTGQDYEDTIHASENANKHGKMPNDSQMKREPSIRSETYTTYISNIGNVCHRHAFCDAIEGEHIFEVHNVPCSTVKCNKCF